MYPKSDSNRLGAFLKHFLVWLVTGLILLLISTLTGQLFGLGQTIRKRRCPNCRTFMRRLAGATDPAYPEPEPSPAAGLDPADHEMWQCPNCGLATVHDYDRWFFGLKECPACGYRTLRVCCQTLVQPTYTSTGLDRISSDCSQCHYHYERTVTTPKHIRAEPAPV